MIIVLGLFDLITVLLGLTAVQYGYYTGLAVILFVLLGVKGAWTIIVSGRTPFLLLGLLDLGAGILSFLSLQNNNLVSLATFSLLIVGFKSLASIIRL